MEKHFNKYFFMIFIMICFQPAFGQTTIPSNHQLQSIIEKLQNRKIEGSKTIAMEELSGKCGLSLMFEIQQNYQLFSPEQKSTIKKLLEPPEMQKSVIVGNFRIHYDTVGYLDPQNQPIDNVPSLLTPSNKRMLADTNYVKNHYDSLMIISQYIDSTAQIFNYVWDYIVNNLGYEPPPFDSSYNEYNIYIFELDRNYGETYWDPSRPLNQGIPQRFATWILIDNDFKDVYSPSRGIPGLKVTAAHELHHAIQIGKYGYWQNDRYFYEITSTWMEDVIYDDINDYYQYVKHSNGHFANPNISFIKGNGLIEYSRAIWGIFIEKKYSLITMRRVWELMRTYSSINALDAALLENGTNFRQAFTEFSKWNYFTEIRSIPDSYYPEAMNYPKIKEETEIEIIGNSRVYNNSLETFSSLYLPIKFQDKRFACVISNININSAIIGNIGSFPFTVNFSTSNDGTYKELVKNLYVKFDVQDPNNWTINTFEALDIREITVVPNPFLTNKDSKIQFLLPPTRDISSKLFIYSSDMSLIYSGEYQLNPIEPKLTWNAKDENGQTVGSGIYFYTIILNNKEHIGKFAIIRK